jgi:hypothetical protein
VVLKEGASRADIFAGYRKKYGACLGGGTLTYTRRT